jgi:hypothetical protein
MARKKKGTRPGKGRKKEHHRSKEPDHLEVVVRLLLVVLYVAQWWHPLAAWRY